jgi:predicted ATP-dependent endonuclease of OLD family
VTDYSQKLDSRWQVTNGRYGLLRGFSIHCPDTNRSLRGIRDIKVELKHPVTFFAGRNGSGKSTVLAIAALAYHGVNGHFPISATIQREKGKRAFGYYTFRDFFHRGPGDPNLTGIEIAWKVDGRPTLLAKKTSRWMRYEGRPLRPVEFLGLIRTLPSMELTALKHHFKKIDPTKIAPFTAKSVKYVSKVMRSSYSALETLHGKKYNIRRLSGGNNYTSFNMGAGEDAIISLIASLEAVPVGSLVVIEELEATLHPAAQREVTKLLLEIAYERDLQIIGSTHSQHVLEALPAKSRMLITREGNRHIVMNAPTAEFALADLSDTSIPELLIICEDDFARSLILQMLEHKLRKRVRVELGGSNSELANQAQSYIKLASNVKVLIIWDGDVLENEIEAYLKKASTKYPYESTTNKITYGKLPGNIAPEKWLLNTLLSKGTSKVTEAFNIETENEAMNILNQCKTENHHTFIQYMSSHTGFSHNDTRTMLIRCICEVATDEILELNNLVRECF